MESERWERTDELFHIALEQPPQQRAAFLRKVCDDDQLRAEIESLLAYAERSQDFLNKPVIEIAACLVVASTREARLQPGAQLGPYRILELLGAGGMGEVYKATDTRLGRAVALKLLCVSLLSPSEGPKRLLREARAASALNHPNICTVYDIGEYQGEPLLVMELLEGHLLQKMLVGKPLPAGKVLELGVQIADALEAAHSHGIIHRDLKPANIFVTSRGQAKILDFGLAKLMREQGLAGVPAESTGGISPEPLLTGYGSNAGTPGYMSPEQARGEVVDARSDLFSVGILLYEMATGQLPFASRISSRSARTRMPRALRRIIGRALENEPADRYQSASELLLDLRGLAKVLARRPAYVAASLLLGLVSLAVMALLAFQPARAPGQPHGAWVQITNFSDSAVDPGLSPDGTMVAFLRGPRTFSTVGQVYIMQLPDGEPRRLTGDGFMKMDPVFSPDGSSIAYTLIDQNWSWDTWVVPVSGGQSRLMLRNASGLSWIGPRELLFSEIKRGLHMAIVTSDEQRARVRDVYIPPNDRDMAHRSYISPNRKWVLLAEMDVSAWLPCRLVPFGGTSPGRQVGPLNARCTSAAWSPDGKWMYFSASTGDGFHTWRQQFPDGIPHQITSGPTEEEGIAVSPDGRSFITSVGTSVSTVWIHDKNGDQPLSDQVYSFSPRFSPTGKQVFYLASQHSRTLLTETGELWSVDLQSAKRRKLPVPNHVVSFAIDTDRNQLLLAAVSPDGRLALWLAPFDGLEGATKVADDVTRMFALSRQEIIFQAPQGPLQYLYRIEFDGTNRRKALPAPIAGLRTVSPDGEWLVVEDSVAFEDARTPTVLYPMGGDTSSRIPLCATCFPSWIFAGRYFQVRFGGISDAEYRPTYLVPIPQGEILPPLFRMGRLVSEEEVARLPGVRVIPEGAPVFGESLDTYVYTKRTVHRNLFRIAID